MRNELRYYKRVPFEKACTFKVPRFVVRRFIASLCKF